MARRKDKHTAEKGADKGAGRTAAARSPADKPAARPPVLKRRKLPNWPLLALALAGLLLTGYLSASAWLGTPPAYCTEGSDCDIVQGSRWGTLLGLPTAAWGFLAYAGLAFVALRVRDAERHWKAAWLIALTGLAVSAYLTVISVAVLQAACAYCLGSLGLIGASVALLVWQRPAGLPAFSWPAWGGQTAGVAAVLVLALHLHYSGVFDPAAGPEDPYLRDLALHLRDTGAAFYGAFWCPACNEQKALFKASVERLPYVECTPHGRNGPRAPECVERNIGAYPTWQVGGQWISGVQRPADLARLSNFLPPPDPR